MSITPIVMIWVVLGLATLALALYRKVLANGEQDVVRLGAGEEKMIPQQEALANKLQVIDKWGKTLTVLTVVIGLGLAATYLYMAFQDPSLLPKNLYRAQ
jgi:hypothetical protein